MRLGFRGEPAGARGFDPAKIKESRPISSNGQRLPSGFRAEMTPSGRCGHAAPGQSGGPVVGCRAGA